MPRPRKPASHAASDVDLEDPNFEHTLYEGFSAYGRSKTANVLFAVELERPLKSRSIRVTALRPGGIMTELLRHTSPDMLIEMAARSSRDADGTNSMLGVKTIEQGVSTSPWAAFIAPADKIGGITARIAPSSRLAKVAVGSRRTLSMCSGQSTLG